MKCQGQGRVFLKGIGRDEEERGLIFNLQLKEFNDSISENIQNECKLDQSCASLTEMVNVKNYFNGDISQYCVV